MVSAYARDSFNRMKMHAPPAAAAAPTSSSKKQKILLDMNHHRSKVKPPSSLIIQHGESNMSNTQLTMSQLSSQSYQHQRSHQYTNSHSNAQSQRSRGLGLDLAAHEFGNDLMKGKSKAQSPAPATTPKMANVKNKSKTGKNQTHPQSHNRSQSQQKPKLQLFHQKLQLQSLSQSLSQSQYQSQKHLEDSPLNLKLKSRARPRSRSRAASTSSIKPGIRKNSNADSNGTGIGKHSSTATNNANYAGNIFFQNMKSQRQHRQSQRPSHHNGQSQSHSHSQNCSKSQNQANASQRRRSRPTKSYTASSALNRSSSNGRTGRSNGTATEMGTSMKMSRKKSEKVSGNRSVPVTQSSLGQTNESNNKDEDEFHNCHQDEYTQELKSQPLLSVSPPVEAPMSTSASTSSRLLQQQTAKKRSWMQACVDVITTPYRRKKASNNASTSASNGNSNGNYKAASQGPAAAVGDDNISVAGDCAHGADRDQPQAACKSDMTTDAKNISNANTNSNIISTVTSRVLSTIQTPARKFMSTFQTPARTPANVVAKVNVNSNINGANVNAPVTSIVSSHPTNIRTGADANVSTKAIVSANTNHTQMIQKATQQIQSQINSQKMEAEKTIQNLISQTQQIQTLLREINQKHASLKEQSEKSDQILLRYQSQSVAHEQKLKGMRDDAEGAMEKITTRALDMGRLLDSKIALTQEKQSDAICAIEKKSECVWNEVEKLSKEIRNDLEKRRREMGDQLEMKKRVLWGELDGKKVGVLDSVKNALHSMMDGAKCRVGDMLVELDVDASMNGAKKELERMRMEMDVLREEVERVKKDREELAKISYSGAGGRGNYAIVAESTVGITSSLNGPLEVTPHPRPIAESRCIPDSKMQSEEKSTEANEADRRQATSTVVAASTAIASSSMNGPLGVTPPPPTAKPNHEKHAKTQLEEESIVPSKGRETGVENSVANAASKAGVTLSLNGPSQVTPPTAQTNHLPNSKIQLEEINTGRNKSHNGPSNSATDAPSLNGPSQITPPSLVAHSNYMPDSKTQSDEVSPFTPEKNRQCTYKKGTTILRENSESELHDHTQKIATTTNNSNTEKNATNIQESFVPPAKHAKEGTKFGKKISKMSHTATTANDSKTEKDITNVKASLVPPLKHTRGGKKFGKKKPKLSPNQPSIHKEEVTKSEGPKSERPRRGKKKSPHQARMPVPTSVELPSYSERENASPISPLSMQSREDFVGGNRREAMRRISYMKNTKELQRSHDVTAKEKTYGNNRTRRASSRNALRKITKKDPKCELTKRIPKGRFNSRYNLRSTTKSAPLAVHVADGKNDSKEIQNAKKAGKNVQTNPGANGSDSRTEILLNKTSLRPALQAKITNESGERPPDYPNISSALPPPENSQIPTDDNLKAQNQHSKSNSNMTMLQAPPMSPDATKHTPLNLIRKEVENPTLAPPKLRARRRKRTHLRNKSISSGDDYQYTSCRNLLGNLLFSNLNISSDFGRNNVNDNNRCRSRSPPPISFSKEKETFSPNGPKALTAPKIPQFSEEDEKRFRPRRRVLPIRSRPCTFDLDSSVVDDVFEFKM